MFVAALLCCCVRSVLDQRRQKRRRPAEEEDERNLCVRVRFRVRARLLLRRCILIPLGRLCRRVFVISVVVVLCSLAAGHCCLPCRCLFSPCRRRETDQSEKNNKTNQRQRQKTHQPRRTNSCDFISQSRVDRRGVQTLHKSVAFVLKCLTVNCAS